MHYKHHKRMMADVQEELRSLGAGEPLKKVWSDPHNSRAAAHMGLTEPKGKLIGHYKIGQHKVHVFDDNEGNHDFVIYHPNQKDRIIGKVSTMENIERDKDDNEIGGQSTSHSYVDDYHRGKGIGRALYQAALHHHGELRSGVALSPHSDKMWRNFKKLSGVKFKAGRINTDKQHYATVAPEARVPMEKGKKFSGTQVAQHLADTDPIKEGGISEQVARVRTMPSWTLARIPIDSIMDSSGSPLTEPLDTHSEAVANEYAEKTTSSPPVVLIPHNTVSGAWTALDGTHRSRAAHLKGHSHVLAYIPEQSSADKPKVLEKGAKGDWQKEGYTLEHSINHDERFTPHWRNHLVIAKDKNGKVAGEYGFSEKITDEKFNVPDFYPAHSKTGEKHRRKGLASAAYALVEQKTGKKLKYSFSQTRAAEKLWAQPNKPFGMTDEEILQEQQKLKLNKSQQDIPEVATVAVVYKNQMLMGKRKDNGKYTHVGGHLEPGESPHDGAIREMYEESGIKADKLESLGSETIKCEDGKTRTIHVFALLGTKPEYVSLKNDPDGEFSKLFWVDVSKGLPDEIKNNLHSPKNVLLKKIGLQ